MSPDIEWRVGEDAEQETIAQTSSTRRTRRSRWALIGAIGLGVGLGLLYRSIPEPDPKPHAPVPTIIQVPTPAPESLEIALQRDAARLAASDTGELVTFDPSLSRMPQAYADWYAALQNGGGHWESIALQSPLTVYETGMLSSGVAWAKVGQFRNNDFFRHTRFYRQQNGRWIWTLPDRSFWQGATATVMTGDAAAIGPITIGHPREDAPMIGAVFDRFTRAYLNLCQSLQCPPPPGNAPPWEPGLTLSITVLPHLMMPDVQERRSTLSINLPSPRVVGIYEDANTPGDPFVAMAYATLLDPMVRLASADYARWETDRGGELFLQAIAAWKRTRLHEELQPLELFYPPMFPPPGLAQTASGPPVSTRENYANALRHAGLLPLDSLWDWPTEGRGFGLLQHVASHEAEAVVAFIEDRYGTDRVVHFLNALGPAQSLEEAVEAALPLSFGEFQREWKQWIGGE